MQHPWYVAQALAGLEATAVYNLSRENVEAYAPSVADRGSRLFPGYIFVSLETVDDSHLVNRTRGIVKMLPIHGNTPTRLPLGFVAELRDRIAGGEFDPPSQEEFLRKFVADDAVVPLTGAYRDQQGRFLRYHKGCGVVLGYLLGKEFEFRVPLHQLRSAPEARAPESRSASKRAA